MKLATPRKPSVITYLAVGVALACLWLIIAPGNDDTIAKVADAPRGESTRPQSSPRARYRTSGDSAETVLDQASQRSSTDPGAPAHIVSENAGSGTAPLPAPSPPDQVVPTISSATVAPVAGSPADSVLPPISRPATVGSPPPDQLRPPIFSPTTVGSPPDQVRPPISGPATVGSAPTDAVRPPISGPADTPAAVSLPPDQEVP